MVRDVDCRIEANHLGQTWFGSWPICIEYDGKARRRTLLLRFGESKRERK